MLCSGRDKIETPEQVGVLFAYLELSLLLFLVYYHIDMKNVNFN